MRSGRASGRRWSRCATFVKGPTGTSTMPGSIRSARKSATSWSTVGVVGSGSSAPSRPVSPWTCGAVCSSRRSGLSAPGQTGMSVRPASSRTFNALRVVLSSVWFPATVLIARSSSSGLASASRIAIASSWPGSQSMMIGVLTAERIFPLRRLGEDGLKTSEPAATPLGYRLGRHPPPAMLDTRRRRNSQDSLTKVNATVAPEPDHVLHLHAEVVVA